MRPASCGRSTSPSPICAAAAWCCSTMTARPSSLAAAEALTLRGILARLTDSPGTAVAGADAAARGGAGPRRGAGAGSARRQRAHADARGQRGRTFCANWPIPAPRPGALLRAAPAAIDQGAADAAVELTKLARLLPAAVMGPVGPRAPPPSSRPRASTPSKRGDVMAYQRRPRRSRCARWRRPRCRWPMPRTTRIIAFRPSDGGTGHIAIVIGEPDPAQPVLVRLHSECFTGDLLGSLRCDCGDQLRGAIAEIARGGQRHPALSRAGGARHRPRQQAARLQSPGCRARYLRRQRAIGLRCRRAGLSAGGRDAAPVGLRPGAAPDQQSRQGGGADALRHRGGRAGAACLPLANGHNERYLRTKATRLGHWL